jgi:hypothetical protein
MKRLSKILALVLVLMTILSAVSAFTVSAADKWEKATSIAVGDTVTLVCESKKMEISSISTTSTKYGIGKAYSSSPAGLMTFEVVAGSTSGTYAFKNGSKYLYWTSGNSLALNSTLNANTSWKVTISSGNATIANAKDNSRKIGWNASSPRFACYTGTQTNACFYIAD